MAVTGSLTPLARADETAREATMEGLVNGALVLVPTAAAVALAMRNPAFVRRTNMQSRTALVIMPPLFAFGLTSETHLTSRMRQIAEENRHKDATVRWAEEQLQQRQQQQVSGDAAPGGGHRLSDLHLSDLYLQSVEQSGVNIVPGDQLGPHHRLANYVQANPIKSLAVLAVPTVATIFRGRAGQGHLDFSVQILHTRVFGQFATLALLLGVMGFKEFMDSHGRYITQAEADARVEEMKAMRQALLLRLQEEKQQREAQQHQLLAAQAEDEKEHKTRAPKEHRQKHKAAVRAAESALGA